MKKYNYSVASRTILGDLETPVGTYLRVRDLYPMSALMESSDYHGGENGRSFIGLCPLASFSVSHGNAIYRMPGNETEIMPLSESFTIDEALENFLSCFNVDGEFSNYCGLYGYTSFNAVRYLENISVKDSSEGENDAPDIYYILYKYIIIFKGFKSEMTLTEMIADGEKDGLDSIVGAIHKNPCPLYDFKTEGPVTSTLTDEQHKANIRKCIDHCRRGDTFQIVISRRFVQRYKGDDFRLYRSLRSINPSPYLYYFDFGGFRIFGSSPETHCRIEGRRAYIDPIAGTTKRTGNVEVDKANALRLSEDPKEGSEHVMLVDLARNDLSRNCHDVKVEYFKQTQFYSHVIHLVSRVSGELDPGVNPIKAFMDTFPAGTLSGAPKVRAMQIISELEPHNRGAYGGCVGFIGLNGNLNQAITIRTFVSRNGTLWFQAGGGIVAKSVDENELQEVNNKLGALNKAIVQANNDMSI
ncbi:MAG: anthranilate synthase component I family protein [Bacteroidales bacterium]|nr:anthranilate synthase component I family protein [Bacteroidales bacterium]MCI1785913.1 anthranilate synthase component I family protein [Bacteroidales bacterium]